MNIRQAAKWAERKGCLYRFNRYTGQPDYLYAVYSTAWKSDNEVLCLGGYDKCSAYMQAHKGEQIKMESLDEVAQGLSESEGEASCYLGEREEGVSWEAV